MCEATQRAAVGIRVIMLVSSKMALNARCLIIIPPITSITKCFALAGFCRLSCDKCPLRQVAIHKVIT